MFGTDSDGEVDRSANNITWMGQWPHGGERGGRAAVGIYAESGYSQFDVTTAMVMSDVTIMYTKYKINKPRNAGRAL